MQAEIDASGRVEITQKHTVLAIANGIRFSIRISAHEKRILIEQLRRQRPEWSKRFTHVMIFATLIFLLIEKHMQNLDRVVIDLEYTGHEPMIKDRIMELCRRRGMKIHRDQIDFQQIGKKSPTHKLGINVYRGKTKPDRSIQADEVLAKF